jgi:hypothetical protein
MTTPCKEETYRSTASRGIGATKRERDPACQGALQPMAALISSGPVDPGGEGDDRLDQLATPQQSASRTSIADLTDSVWTMPNGGPLA